MDLDDFIKNDYVQKLNNKLYRLNIKNKNKFLIVREQGVGDEILYSSMYEEVLEELENVMIECDPRLLNSLKIISKI